jgi:hypothetical protein
MRTAHDGSTLLRGILCLNLVTMNIPSLSQLKRAVLIAEKLEQLEQELADILGQKPGAPKADKGAKPVKAKKTKRTMSPEAREKIAAAQRKRWAKSKRAKKAEAPAS